MVYRFIKLICFLLIALVGLLAILITAFIKSFKKKRTDPRLLWGFEPIINIKYWSKALSKDFTSHTFVTNLYSIHKEDDFDILVKFEGWRRHFLPYRYFCWSVINYDILHFSYNGWLLAKTPLASLEPFLLKLCKVKTVVFPYGSDAFVIRWIRDVSAQTCLLLSYPEMALRQNEIEKQVKRWVTNADICFSSLMCPDGLGRWDFITPNCIAIDTDQVIPVDRFNSSDGKDSTRPIVVAHCPNHRGVKGTEFIIEAIKKLKSEGYFVELLLVENMKNAELLELLRKKADILLDQLILPGYGMNAIEAMALGLPVMANVGIEDYSVMYRRFSYLSKCPIQNVNPENIVDQLRNLITSPDLRKNLSVASREFSEKYHSYSFFRFLFGNVYKKVWNKENVDLMRLFHPLSGIYEKAE